MPTLEQVDALLSVIVIYSLIGYGIFFWIRRSYIKDKTEFTIENPHLNGKYYSMWQWFYVNGEEGGWSYERKKAFFGDDFTDTNSVGYTIKKIYKKTSWRNIVILLALVGGAIYYFYLLDPENFFTVADILADAQKKSEITPPSRFNTID